MIEIDGDTHAATVDHDAIRTQSIEREGYRVIRLANIDVMENVEGVLTQISFSLREKEGARRASGGQDERHRARKKGGTA